jgi:hypothetical protein
MEVTLSEVEDRFEYLSDERWNQFFFFFLNKYTYIPDFVVLHDQR